MPLSEAEAVVAVVAAVAPTRLSVFPGSRQAIVQVPRQIAKHQFPSGAGPRPRVRDPSQPSPEAQYVTLAPARKRPRSALQPCLWPVELRHIPYGGFGLHPLPTGARGICTIRKDPLRFLDLERVITYLPEDSCSCRHGGAERLLPDGREWGSGGLDRPTRRIPRLDL